MKILAHNSRASFDYTLLEKYQAGIQLLGNEVKSVKLGQASLKGAYIGMQDNQLFLMQAHISHYQQHSQTNYDLQRPRKLLLKRAEIQSLIAKKTAAGLTIIPIKLYLSSGLVKLEIALAKGKKKLDKRSSIRQKEESRSIQRILKTR